MRSKKVVKNAIAGLAYQILSVIYGLKWINDIRNEGKSLKKKKKKN